MNKDLDQSTVEFLKYRTAEEKDYSVGRPGELPYNFFAIKMDLPPVPEQLLNSVYDNSNAQILTRGSDRTLKVDNNEEQSAPLRRWSVEQALTDWVTKNIATGFTNVAVQVIHGDTSHKKLGAHTDRRRRFSLYYLVQEGGQNIQTKWYAKKGQPAWQDKWIAETDYNNLDLLHSERLLPFQWYLFNGRIIHDVDALESTRKNIIVGFDILPKYLEEIARAVS